MLSLIPHFLILLADLPVLSGQELNQPEGLLPHFIPGIADTQEAETAVLEPALQQEEGSQFGLDVEGDIVEFALLEVLRDGRKAVEFQEWAVQVVQLPSGVRLILRDIHGLLCLHLYGLRKRLVGQIALCVQLGRLLSLQSVGLLVVLAL